MAEGPPADISTHMDGVHQGNSRGNYESMAGHLPDGKSTAERSTGINAAGMSRSTRGCPTCRRPDRQRGPRTHGDPAPGLRGPGRGAARARGGADAALRPADREHGRGGDPLGAARRPAADRGAPPPSRRRRAAPARALRRAGAGARRCARCRRCARPSSRRSRARPTSTCTCRARTTSMCWPRATSTRSATSRCRWSCCSAAPCSSGDDGRLQTARIGWESEAEHRLPVRVPGAS